MIKKWIFRLALAGIALFSVLLYQSKAMAYSPFELREVSITYRSFFPGGTDPIITQNGLQPDKALGKEVDLTVNNYLLDIFYWDNTIHSMTDQDASTHSGGQFRMVGWEFGFGVDARRIWEGFPVRVGYYHYSRHTLDTLHSLGHFPVEDALEVKLFLYGKGQ